MTKSKSYYHIQYINEKGNLEYNYYYDASIYDITFKNRMALVTVMGNLKSISKDSCKNDFIVAFPLNRIVRIDKKELTDKEAAKRGLI